MSEQTDTIKDTSRIILFSVGALILAGLVFFAYKYFNEKQINDENEAKINSLNEEILALEEKIYDFESTIEDQHLELAEKTKQLGEKDEQIEDLLNRLSVAKQEKDANLGKIRQLEEKVKQLQRFVDQYKTQVAELEARNQELETRVADLSASEQALEQSYSELQSYNEETEQKLEETIKVASVLQTSDFSVCNIRKNGSEKCKENYNNKRIDQIKVCFSVRENLVAEPGMREVYMVVENPDGSINTNYESNESGTFSYEGIEKEYSATTSFDYARLMQEVCVQYAPTSQDKHLAEGIYYINMYCDGNLIGQTSMELK